MNLIEYYMQFKLNFTKFLGTQYVVGFSSHNPYKNMIKYTFAMYECDFNHVVLVDPI